MAQDPITLASGIGQPPGDSMILSGRDLIQNTILAHKNNKAYIDLANKNNSSEMEAFLHLDKHRFKIKSELIKKEFATSLEK